MREIRNFNQNWLFAPCEADINASDNIFESVTLPHSNKLFDHRSVNDQDYQFVSTYRKYFSIEETQPAKRIFLDFDGVMAQASVYLNGTHLGHQQGGYTPFSFEITEALQIGENVLTVYVDSTEDPAIPPFGGRVDFLTFGGIYRDVNLRIVPQNHLADIFVKPQDVLTQPSLACEIELNAYQPQLNVVVALETLDGQRLTETYANLSSEKLVVALQDLPAIELWSIDAPNLYQLVVTLYENDDAIDQTTVCFGFRQAEFSADGNFYLNGEVLPLFGLNRHQTYPYIGAAAPVRLQELDADILKDELGCNIVRTSHYPQSPHFIKRCDEIGLLVFEEIPGWQHIGDDAWQKLVLRDVQAMVKRDRNHPSIILWGVRINESPDDATLYQQANQLAHDLDPTRQTGGVRNFIQSEQFEDVFTLNDFPPGIQTPRSKPHLITEFGGHMFPTKTWDNEERRIAHALHHAQKQNDQIGHPDVAGGIGWCAFDYHTHYQFGSGDRICHHGVMDIFRLPKMAAYFYRSQKSPTSEIVLYPATSWTVGDRNEGGNNPLVIFSNCEEIAVWVGDKLKGRYQPASAQFPHLDHPPFFVSWSEPYNPWGGDLEDLRVQGLINGDVVIEHRLSSTHVPHGLEITSHTTTLQADGADMARIVIRLIDRYGNTLPYFMPVVSLTLEGDADLIGENPLALVGGQTAVFVKARHTAGTVVIQAQTPHLDPVALNLKISD